MSATCRPADQFCTIGEAARLLGVSPFRARRIVERGAVTTRQLPGSVLEVSREDIERIAREAVIPAGAAVGA
jgi:hypothetical protein